MTARAWDAGRDGAQAARQRGVAYCRQRAGEGGGGAQALGALSACFRLTPACRQMCNEKTVFALHLCAAQQSERIYVSEMTRH